MPGRPQTVRLVVLDDTGAEIASIKHDESGDVVDRHPMLVELFDAAKRAAIQSDERLERLLTTLESGL